MFNGFVVIDETAPNSEPLWKSSSAWINPDGRIDVYGDANTVLSFREMQQREAKILSGLLYEYSTLHKLIAAVSIFQWITIQL